MNRYGKPLTAAVRAVMAGAAISTALGLAACGSAVAGGTRPATPSPGGAGGRTAGTAGAGGVNAGGPSVPGPGAPASAVLCTRISSLERVVITHTAGMMTTRMREVQPVGVTVRDPARVRALASAVCALPLMPPGLHCPADFGVSYRLMFTTFTKAYNLVTVQAAGCRAVMGLGHARWWARSPRLWQAMRQALASGSALLPGRQGSVPTP